MKQQSLFKTRKHTSHCIHPHTRMSWLESRWLLTGRKLDIITEIENDGPGTDRQIMGRLGFSDPNAVRPFITMMVKDGMLIESGSEKCRTSGRTVRVTSLPKAVR